MDLSGAAAPSARVGMSLTRLGWGEHARLVLYGGYEEGGFASSDLYFFGHGLDFKAALGEHPELAMRIEKQIRQHFGLDPAPEAEAPAVAEA